jgi:hypothetical protein
VGAGQCNGDFTVSRDATFPGTPGGSGIELGMRIEQRSVGQLNPHTPLAECEALPVSFRDVRRPNDINAGLDLAGTEQLALNFTGSAAAAGDTWITVFDVDPNDSTPTTFGATTVGLCAEVSIHRQNNKKGAGLLALFNEGAPASSSPRHPAAHHDPRLTLIRSRLTPSTRANRMTRSELA